MLKVKGVLLVNGRPLVQAVVRMTLNTERDLALLAIVADDNEVRRFCRHIRPDVTLLALDTLAASPVQAATHVSGYCSASHVLVLAESCDGERLPGLMATGIAGYVLEDEIPTLLANAIRLAARGGICLSRPVMEKLLHSEPEKTDLMTSKVALTERQLVVLRLIVEGLTNREIALRLGIKVPTVESHVSHILQKLGVSSRVEAAVWAKDHHLV